MMVGAAIGIHVEGIWAAFGLGLASHYLLDFLPHWDYLKQIDVYKRDHQTKIAIDFLTGAAAVSFLAAPHLFKGTFIMAVLGALMPDFIALIRKTFDNPGWLKWHHYFHCWIHHWHGLSFPKGIPLTILAIVASIFFIL